MALISPKEVVDKIKEVVETQMTQFFVRADYQPISAEDIEKAKDFPRLYLFINDTQGLLENNNNFVLDMRAYDLATGREKTWERDLEIKSDMFLAMSILFDILEGDDVISGDITINPQPQSEVLNNGLSGYSVSATFPLAKPCKDVAVVVQAEE